MSSPPLNVLLTEFVSRCGQPVLIDGGEEPLELRPECWTVSDWNGRAVLQAWDGRRNLVRKITALKEQARDRIVLATERFPKAVGEMQICDFSAPGGRELERRTTRVAFRERVRLILARLFPGWDLEDLSSEANLEQSLSPTFVRSFLRKGSSGIAAMAVPPNSPDPAAVVAFGLIWLDYVRKREPKVVIRQLLFFAEEGAARAVSNRVRWIHQSDLHCEVHVFDSKDRACPVDWSSDGNKVFTLAPCERPVTPNHARPHFAGLDEVDCVPQSDGSVRFQVRGLDFARWAPSGNGGRYSCGIARKHRCSAQNVVELAREILRVRSPEAEDRLHPLYTQSPEGWMEAEVRRDPETVDATLMPAPLYGQVLLAAGVDRGMADLLAIDRSGRLALLELKAAAEIQLPFQALDYWSSIRQHLESGDFERSGYFPGQRLVRDAPRILLVAPALEFHSTSETILSYLDPRIEFTRIGLASDWRRSLRVMFRLNGPEQPD